MTGRSTTTSSTSPGLAPDLAGEPSTALGERAATLLDALEEGIAVFDRDGRLSSFNATLPILLGLTAAELRAQAPLGLGSLGMREDGTAFPEGGDPVQATAQSGLAFSRVLLGIRLPNHPERWLSVNCRRF